MSYLCICSREIDDMIKQKNYQLETMKSLENEITKLNLRKKDFETDVSTIMEEFEQAKNRLCQMVCIILIKLYRYYY